MYAKTGSHWVRLSTTTILSLLIWMVLARASGATYSFTNSQFISIDDSTNSLTKATPYPSTNYVVGLTGQVVTKVTVTLHGLSHTFPSDVSVLLVGPQGQRAVVMSETGGQSKYSVTNLTLTFDDDATNSLPVYTSLVSGSFKPTDGYVLLGYPQLPYDFPTPAPPGNSNSVAALSIFKNTDPDGLWNLYVLCDSGGSDSGSLSNGWSLGLSVLVPLQETRSQTNVILSWPGSATNCHLQFLSGPLGANGWSNVLNAPALNAGLLSVTNPISSTNTFFRLVGN